MTSPVSFGIVGSVAAHTSAPLWGHIAQEQRLQRYERQFCEQNWRSSEVAEWVLGGPLTMSTHFRPSDGSVISYYAWEPLTPTRYLEMVDRERADRASLEWKRGQLEPHDYAGSDLSRESCLTARCLLVGSAVAMKVDEQSGCARAWYYIRAGADGINCHERTWLIEDGIAIAAERVEAYWSANKQREEQLLDATGTSLCTGCPLRAVCAEER